MYNNLIYLCRSDCDFDYSNAVFKSIGESRGDASKSLPLLLEKTGKNIFLYKYLSVSPV